MGAGGGVVSRKRRKPQASRPQPSGPPATPASRLWLFRAVLVLVPFALLVLLELLLRGFGYGADMGFVLRREVRGEPRLLSNPRFPWRFFEPAAARVPPPFSLPLRKPPGAVRVFVLGGSAAEGDPEPSFGIARQLEVLLRDRYPGAAIEVVNAAVTAVNSHYVYAAARAALALEPDVLVVYVGNNEVVGPYGAGTIFTAAAPPLLLVRAAVAVQGTRLGQLVGGLVRAAAGGIGVGRAPGAWHGMKMFLEQQRRPDDPALERAYRNYEGNLADTCRLARTAGVPLVLSTVAVNLRSCGPFASPEAAELYRLGRAEAQLGRDERARSLLAQARDLDTLRFRADSRTNAIVREVAQRQPGARLVDAAEALARQAPHHAPGDESFLDHVHPTFHGNYLLAVALLDAVGEALPASVHVRASNGPPLAESEAARRLVFTDLDRYNIAETMQQRLREPPFTNQPDHAEQQKRFVDEMAELRTRGDQGGVDQAVMAYEQALAAPHPHWSLRERYAAIQRRLRRPDLAVAQLEVLVREFPQQPGFEVLLSRALRDAGRFADARAALQKVLDYRPDAPVTLVELAQLELAQGRFAEATQAARRAVALDPFDANALNLLAASLCPRRQCGLAERQEALGLLERALQVAPDSDVVKRGLEELRRTP
jgi:tetratricopeptide (TPR) repeat protein